MVALTNSAPQYVLLNVGLVRFEEDEKVFEIHGWLYL